MTKYSEKIQGFPRKSLQKYKWGNISKHPLKSTSHSTHKDFRDNIYPSFCHTECSYNMHPIGISRDAVKFECTIKPYVVEFHFTKHTRYWLRRGTPSTSNLFIGGIMYYTCNKLLSVFVTKSQKSIQNKKNRKTFSYLYM